MSEKDTVTVTITPDDIRRAMLEIATSQRTKQGDLLGHWIDGHPAIVATIKILEQDAAENNRTLREAVRRALLYGIELGYQITIASAGLTSKPDPKETRH